MSDAPKSRAATVARTVAPWLVAASILGYLFYSIDLDAVGDAMSRVSLPAFGALIVAMSVGLISLDTFALWVAFREAIPEARLSPRDVLNARAPSYLLAIVNYGAGQGGVVYFLKRNNDVPLARGVGAVLLTSSAYVFVVAALVGIGLLAGAVPDDPTLRWVIIAMASGAPLYLIVVALRPGWLARRALLAPLFEAGLVGTLRVAGARVIYVLALLASHWAALRLFDVDVPIADGLARLPLLFFLAALPIAPAGLGTTQAAAIALFRDYGATASVLAYSLSVQVAATIVLAAVGLGFLRRATRQT
jgi:uncharacterized membrane protein YbhN (UPF0104 family)